jgi:nitrite reductase/ring-hydroxylating ferredoxin subunit
MSAQGWWAAALTESVSGDKPLGVVCDQQEIVLFRDSTGKAVALEDRCPHRRVPLSLGCIKANGLQCAYHGWTFHGTTGTCTAIPNLGDNEKVPARYGAIPYPVVEGDGFVHVWLGAGQPERVLSAHTGQPRHAQVKGTAIVSIPHDQYLAAMLDGTHALLAFDGVAITDFFLGDARVAGNHLVLDRGAVWKGRLPAPAFVTEHPLIVRTHVPLSGGHIRIELLTAAEQRLATVELGTSANRRDTTGICWRGYSDTDAVAGAPLRWRLRRALGKPLVEVFTQIDGVLLASLLAEPSQQLRARRYQQPTPLRFAV